MKLTKKQRKEIDSRIRGCAKMSADVERWRNEQITIAGSSIAVTRQPGGASGDPTGDSAVRLGNPPEHIRVKKLWVEAIGAANKMTEGTLTAEVAKEWYGGGIWKSPQRAAQKLHMDERTMYRHIREYRETAAAAAIKRGVLDIEKQR